MNLFFRIKERFHDLLSLNDSPHHIALSFAIGIFISITPFLGFHTLMAILVIWLFRLNKVGVLVGTFTNNPWTFTPVYGFGLWLGVRLYGIEGGMPHINWSGIKLDAFVTYLKPYLMPFIIGNLLLGLIAAMVSYFIVSYAVQRFRARGRQVDT